MTEHFVVEVVAAFLLGNRHVSKLNESVCNTPLNEFLKCANSLSSWTATVYGI